ncbi:MAG: creatininase family protein [Planctomycetes bacterium]|nr:creatininase family protein [Planctomycetota bacterium]
MADREAKVRFEEMLPHEIAEARAACPVAYLPVGGLEWHGRHNCVGLDAVKVHAMCMHVARETGGVVFPTLFYGDQRESHLMDANHDPDGLIAADYGLTKRDFAPGYMHGSPFERKEQSALLMVHCLREMAGYGFEVLAIAAGHYPLLSTARAACQLFYNDRGQIAWAFTGFELVRDRMPASGDHAGPWETSLMLALRPDLVDLSRAEGPCAIGDLYERVHDKSSAEFGRQALDLITDRVSEVNHRCLAALRNPDPSLFEVPCLAACRGARRIAELREGNHGPA